MIVVCYAVRGSTGFGAAAAMPMLALVVPLKTLVPVWTLLGLASSVTIVARDHRAVAVHDLLRTLPTGLIGIAVGLYVLILTLSVVRGLGYAAVGEFGVEVLTMFALALPMMLIGIFIGDRFHAGMSETTFRRMVGTVLIVSGSALIWK